MKTILLTLLLSLSLLSYSQYPLTKTILQQGLGAKGASFWTGYADAIVEVNSNYLVLHRGSVDTMFVGNYRLPIGNETLSFDGRINTAPCKLVVKIDNTCYKFKVVYTDKDLISYYIWATLEKDLTWSSGRLCLLYFGLDSHWYTNCLELRGCHRMLDSML